jgi:hypothetical protein
VMNWNVPKSCTNSHYYCFTYSSEIESTLDKQKLFKARSYVVGCVPSA